MTFALDAALLLKVMTADADTAFVGRQMAMQIYSSLHAEQSRPRYSSIISEWAAYVHKTTPSMLHSLTHQLNGLRDADIGGRERPTATAIATAQQVLERTHALNILPNCIMASAEGGVFIAFTAGGHTANVEVFNEGVTYAATRRDGVQVWPVGVEDQANLDDALARIRAAIRD